MATPELIERWHQVLANNDLGLLDGLLADEAVFESPVVFKPQVGKSLTTMYLAAAAKLLNNGAFRYTNSWYAERSAVLEFETELSGIVVNGVDMIFWNDEGKIVRFKVMIRPRKAIEALQDAMARLLASGIKPG